ncbi:MAG: hypothetical protein HXY25_11000 [Alphaproteobacteria bacterium]|nr:hypothetical protein [Alphaproteobacteria bacterium]
MTVSAKINRGLALALALPALFALPACTNIPNIGVSSDVAMIIGSYSTNFRQRGLRGAAGTLRVCTGVHAPAASALADQMDALADSLTSPTPTSAEEQQIDRLHNQAFNLAVTCGLVSPATPKGPNWQITWWDISSP